MKKIYSALLTFSLITSSCEVLEDIVTTQIPGSKNTLTNDEVISGLKEALNIGLKKSTDQGSLLDGFWKNELIRIAFPEDALKVKQKALEWGFNAQVEKFELTLNRAAEEATKEALPIFKEAILNMSIQDGFTILRGGDGAATKFLKDNTSSKLAQAFTPKVKNAISKVKLTEYWNPIINKYNNAMTITGGQKINPDLENYITEKTIIGLFKLVEIEENKIRKDPTTRVTSLLQKVFGSL